MDEPIPHVERRSDTITVVVAPTEKRAIARAAENCDMAVSEWVRRVLMVSLMTNPRDLE